MKIGIDCRMMGSGYGIGRYIEQLVLHLQKIDQDNQNDHQVNKNQYVLFLKKDNYNSLKLENSNFTKVLADMHWYGLKEQLKLKKIIQDEKVDLVHFPHWNIPLSFNDPYIVTIHDLIMFHYPRPEASTRGRMVFWLKDKVHRLVIQRAVKKAKHIIATSEFTKQDVVKTFKVLAEKITVVYQAPFAKDLKAEDVSACVLQKYGIDKPFALCVGAAYPHKNLNSLLEAWILFNKKHDNDCQLVLVGKEDYFYKQLKSKIDATINCIYIGYVDDKELVRLYKQASLYVFPSLYEGFGLPPLEAMSYNLPVISSNRTSLPEVLGEAALYFDPKNIEQMADCLNKGFFDEEIRYELQVKSREVINRYSWENLAEETIELYTR